MQSSLQTRALGRSVLAATALAGLAIGGVTACGDFPTTNNDPLTNAASAQSVVEQFVDSYNEAGVRDAVERTFCSADVADNSGDDLLGDADFTAGSMEITTPATTDGSSGEAGVRAFDGDRAGQNYTVTLRDDDSQGWCITALNPAPAPAG